VPLFAAAHDIRSSLISYNTHDVCSPLRSRTSLSSSFFVAKKVFAPKPSVFVPSHSHSAIFAQGARQGLQETVSTTTTTTTEDVVISNDRLEYTAISIKGEYDRAGLLDDLVGIVERFGLVVQKASISTVGKAVSNVFYVSTRNGNQVDDNQLLAELKAALYKELFSGLSSRQALKEQETVSVAGTGAYNFTISVTRLEGITITDAEWEDQSEIVVLCRDRRENILHDVTKVLRYLKLNVHAAEISNVNGKVRCAMPSG